MKLKHNKKRNTAFLYQILIRNIAKSILEKKESDRKNLLKIVKEHFSKDSLLKRELDLYQTLDQTVKHPHFAERIVQESIRTHEKIDKTKLFNEQTELIKKMNSSIGKDGFSIFIPNYKTLASIKQLFDYSLPIKTRVIMEARIIHNMISKEEEKDNLVPTDSLTYGIFIKKFNEKYGKELLPEQKELLRKYITSFPGEGVDLKLFVNEEVSRLKTELSAVSDEKERSGEVKSLLEALSKQELDDKALSLILKTQQLLKELKS